MHLPAFGLLRQQARSLLAKAQGNPSVKNVLWSGASYLAAPAVQLVCAPFLIHRLGTDVYGVWMLVNSVLAVSGLASLGLGDATIKYVAQYRAKNDPEAVVRVIRSTLTLYVLLGLLAALVISALAPLLATRVFGLPEQHRVLAIQAMRVAAWGLLLRFIYATVEAVARGFERYDLESKYAIFNTIATVTTACAVVAAGYGLVQILLASLLVLGVGTAALTLSLWPLLRTWRWLCPTLHLATLRETLSFGLFSWIQGFSGLLLMQADRLIIATVLGPTPLTYYAVCVQLTQLAHGFISKSLAFIFPKVTILASNNEGIRLRSVFDRGLHVTTLLGGFLSLLLLVFGQPFIRLWLGADFASHTNGIIELLALATGVSITGIVPYYCLNGAGLPRINATLGLVSGAMLTLAAWLVASQMGLLGVAASRLLNLPLGVFNRCYVIWRLFRSDFWLAGLAPVVPVGLSSSAAYALMRYMHPAHERLWESTSRVASFAVGCAILFISAKVFSRRKSQSACVPCPQTP